MGWIHIEVEPNTHFSPLISSGLVRSSNRNAWKSFPYGFDHVLIRQHIALEMTLQFLMSDVFAHKQLVVKKMADKLSLLESSTDLYGKFGRSRFHGEARSPFLELS